MDSSRSSTTPTTSSTSSSRSASLSSLRMTNLYKATMNRFLQRRKAQNALEAEAPAPSSSKKDKKNKKKPTPEPEPQLDLSAALPSNDDFRTSLLMPKMSARFSMLREQDDPESLIGKASDDSVLSPKRQSRLFEFGYAASGLSDIAEVSSINGSVRPPYAYDRKGSVDQSYGSDTDSLHGSIMSRKRPGEGNVLFGGRQKVYLGNRALYEDDVGLSPFQQMKREEKRKQKEEEEMQAAEGEDEQQEQEQQEQHDAAPGSPAGELKHSSSFTGSLRRETSSSTTSGADPRTSTAATSVASQGASSIAPTSSIKGRRLYEQGLDRNIHEQQHSALNRLNSIQQQGRATPPLTQSRSATGLSERFRRPSNSLRVASPPPTAPLANMSGFMAAKESGPSTSSSPISSVHQTPPISPLGINIDEKNPLSKAIDSNDRGKATAMGAFHKPSKQFDQTEYLQRQKQMLEGRQTPPLRKQSSASTVQDRLEKFEKKRSDPPSGGPSPSRSVQGMRDNFEMRHVQSKSSLRSETKPVVEPQEHLEPERSESATRSRSRSNSSGIAPFPIIYADFTAPPPRSPSPPMPIQEVEEPAEEKRSLECAPRSRSRTNSSGLAPSILPPPPPISAPPAAPLPAIPPMPSSPPKMPPPPTPSAFSVFQKAAGRMRGVSIDREATPRDRDTQHTFFAAQDDSDSEEEEVSPGTCLDKPKPQVQAPPPTKEDAVVTVTETPAESPVAPSLMDHPALRSYTTSPVTRASENLLATINSPHETDRQSSVSTVVKSDATDIDSPTLGPETNNLNGMIREHLRRRSNVSSFYDDLPPAQMDSGSNNKTSNSVLSDTPAHSSYSPSNPWDLEDLDDGFYGEGDSLSSISPIDAVKPKAPRSSGDVNPFIGGTTESASESAAVTPWEQELKGHNRNVSMATAAEREAFERELAERQKAIQETLKSKVEASSRAGSPTPSLGGAFKAFGMLRSKTSRETLANRQDSKSLRMFGLGGGNASSTSLARSSDEQWRGQDVGKANKSWKEPINEVEPDDDYRREFEEQLMRGASGDGNMDARSIKGPSPQPPKTGRNRASSNLTSERSRSRSGRRPDDAEDIDPLEMPPPIPGTFPSSGMPTPESVLSTSSTEQLPGPPPIPSRKNSRPNINVPGYFDQKSLHPVQTGLPSIPSPRLSPGQVAPQGLSPRPSISGGPSPARSPAPTSVPPRPPHSANPFSSQSTISTTPSSPTSSTNSAPPTGRAMPRKKSIQKSIISEPMFVSTTNVADTIELPPGASLKNGAPPVPPINPMRRRFGFGRSDSRDSSTTLSDRRGSTDDTERKKSISIRLRKGSTTTLRMSQEGEEPMPAAARSVPSPMPTQDGSMF